MCKQPFFKEKRANYEYFQDTILLKEGPYMYSVLQSILRMTAWPMTPPVPYSAFHILLTVFGAGFAVSFARFFGKKYGPWHRLNRISAIFSFPVEYFLHSWNSISRHFYMSSNFTGISTGGIFHSSSAAFPCTSVLLHRSFTPKNTSPRRHLPSGFRAAGRNHGPGCAARTHAPVLDDDAPWLPLAFYSALPWTFILYVRHRRT